MANGTGVAGLYPFAGAPCQAAGARLTASVAAAEGDGLFPPLTRFLSQPATGHASPDPAADGLRSADAGRPSAEPTVGGFQL